MTSKAKEVDKKFLKEFLQTQIWAYYLEQHYENLKQATAILVEKK